MGHRGNLGRCPTGTLFNPSPSKTLGHRTPLYSLGLFQSCCPQQALPEWSWCSRLADFHKPASLQWPSPPSPWQAQMCCPLAATGQMSVAPHSPVWPRPTLTLAPIRSSCPSALTYQMCISTLGQKSRSLNSGFAPIHRGGCFRALFHLNYVRNQKEPLKLGVLGGAEGAR